METIRVVGMRTAYIVYLSGQPKTLVSLRIGGNWWEWCMRGLRLMQLRLLTWSRGFEKSKTPFLLYQCGIGFIYIGSPPSLSFFKIDFDGSTVGSSGGARFVFRVLTRDWLELAGSIFLRYTIPGMNFRATWVGILYASLAFGANWLVVKGYYAMLVS